MRRPITLAALLAVSQLVPAGAVHADAISPPPTSCPVGSVPIACHGPQTCRLVTCTGDGDCGAGETCLPRDLCLREHCCGGIGCVLDGSTPPRYQHVESPCGTGGSCASIGTTCETVRVCVPTTKPDGGLTDGGGSDGGGPDVDAGDADMDGGSSTDGGSSAMDGGGSGDGGGAGMDSGPAGGADAGPPVTDGGCCSVSGRRGGLGGLVGLGFLLAALLRLGRRRRR